MAERSRYPQARRSVLGLLGGLALGLLGGCQVVPGGPDRPEVRPAPPRAIARPAPRPAPVMARPPVAQAPLPRDTDRNRVAVLVPLTGPNAGVGQSIANAANLALLDAGDGAIRITVYDTAKGAAAAANAALAAGNGLFLGPLLAEDVRAVAPAAKRAGVPVVAFSNDVSVAGGGVYLMGFNPSQSIERVVGYARERGLERFAGLIPDGVYGRRSSQALLGAVERGGGRMVAMQSFDRSPGGLKVAVGSLNAQAGYDAVLIADNGRIALAAAPVVRGGPSRGARILGTELWKSDASLPAQPALRGAWFASVPDTMFNQLRERYRARYRSAPYRLASLGYDAVLMAVRIGRDWRMGTPFPEGELRIARGFAGIDGAFRFGPDGVAERLLEVQEVGAGTLTTVSPAPRTFGR